MDEREKAIQTILAFMLLNDDSMTKAELTEQAASCYTALAADAIPSRRPADDEWRPVITAPNDEEVWLFLSSPVDCWAGIRRGKASDRREATHWAWKNPGRPPDEPNQRRPADDEALVERVGHYVKHRMPELSRGQARDAAMHAIAEYRHRAHDPEIARLTAQLREAREVVEEMVAEKSDYMWRNRLGDPAMESTIKRARAFLAKLDKEQTP